MDPLRWHDHPPLRRPLMIAAFEGWNDAADAASSAVGHLAGAWDAAPFADIDPEEFFDFTAARPQVALDGGLTRRIEWPPNEFLAARPDGSAHDVIFLRGTEPHLRWRTFCEAVIEVATTMKVEMVITLAAVLADVAHTRPVRVTGSAGDQDLAARLHLSRSRYEGPTGIVGVLSEALDRNDIPSASLWAAVPHYVSQTPSPKAALALVERSSALVGVPVPVVDLQIAAASYERQVSDLVESDPEVAEYVSALEMEDGAERDDDDDGESLADEVERFLREHGSG